MTDKTSASFDITEQSYIQTVLYIILIAVCMLTTAIIITPLFSIEAKFEIGALVVFVICSILLWLTYQQKLFAPRLLVPTLAYAVATYISITGKGIRDHTLFLYPIAILLSGLLVGAKGILLYTVMTVITLTAIGYADITHMVPSHLSAHNTAGNIIFLDLIMIMTGAILYMMINTVHKNMQHAVDAELVCEQRYQELRSLNTLLEEQVSVRMQNALEAQAEAENAKVTLEKRMWQYEGKALLSDMLRGDQNVTTLAHKIIRHLCEYLEVPVGALFLMKNQVLYLTGAYAYHMNEDLPQRFAVGEGIIGQAAYERRIIKMSDVPTNYIDIISGLGNAPTRHILAVPFTLENSIVGVIEIGSFAELFPHQIQFIESILNDIAIVFNTAQARARIDSLLQETKQLAEALKTQEEELRAANEELEVQTERLRESYARLEQQTNQETLE